MKTTSPAYIAVLILLCGISLVMFSCHSSDKAPAQNHTENLKELDKNTLLIMIDSVAKTLGKKGANMQNAKAVVKSYYTKYKFKVNDWPSATADTGNVYVNFRNDKDVMFGLSEKIQKQVSFTDLKSKFGPWSVGILPKEVITIPVSFTVNNAGNEIHILVQSEKLPDQKDNAIDNITVMRPN